MSFIGFASAVNYKDMWTVRDFTAQLSKGSIGVASKESRIER